MAAYSLVGESMTDPSAYYHKNVVAGLSLLDAMKNCGVGKIIFSSTAAVYGEPEIQPITEEAAQAADEHLRRDQAQRFEKMLKWFDAAYGIKYTSLPLFQRRRGKRTVWRNA